MKKVVYKKSVPQRKGQDNRDGVVVQGTVAAMTMAGLGLIKGYKEKKNMLLITSILLIVVLIAFLRHYFS